MAASCGLFQIMPEGGSLNRTIGLAVLRHTPDSVQPDSKRIKCRLERRVNQTVFWHNSVILVVTKALIVSLSSPLGNSSLLCESRGDFAPQASEKRASLL